MVFRPNIDIYVVSLTYLISVFSSSSSWRVDSHLRKQCDYLQQVEMAVSQFMTIVSYHLLIGCLSILLWLTELPLSRCFFLNTEGHIEPLTLVPVII